MPSPSSPVKAPVTSQAYFEQVYINSGRFDNHWRNQLQLTEGIPLDKAQTFYMALPFLEPMLDCNPYDLSENMVKSKPRYHAVFMSLEEAEQNIQFMDSEMTLSGGASSVRFQLASKCYLHKGIIYSFHVCPRIIIDALASGSYNKLIPSISSYHLQKLRPLKAHQKIALSTLGQPTYRLTPALQQLTIEISATPELACKLPMITQEIPIKAIEAVFAGKPLAFDKPSLHVEIESDNDIVAAAGTSTMPTGSNNVLGGGLSGLITIFSRLFTASTQQSPPPNENKHGLN